MPAIDDIDRAIKLADRPYLHFRRGLMYSRTSQYEHALEDFDTAINWQPENTQFYRGRSLARSATGDGAGALADAEFLLATAGSAGHRLYARGVAYATLGQDALAVRDFDEALRSRPELLYVLPARAVSYERLGRFGEAAADRQRMEQANKWYDECRPNMSPFHTYWLPYREAFTTTLASPRPRNIAAGKPKVGRNAPCPCGSGKKYKYCCGSARTLH